MRFRLLHVLLWATNCLCEEFRENLEIGKKFVLSSLYEEVWLLQSTQKIVFDSTCCVFFDEVLSVLAGEAELMIVQYFSFRCPTRYISRTCHK